MISACARLFGPDAALRIKDLQKSEIAALYLNKTGTPPPPKIPKVMFLIPLVGKHHVSDWDAVQRRLAATIASFRAQTSPYWSCVVCGQDEPDQIDFGERVVFLPFEAAVEGNDKWAKLAALVRNLPTDGMWDGYVMPFDADDLLHPNAVAEMIGTAAPGGYLISTGYIKDVAADRVGLAGPRTVAMPLRKPFWKLCGSTAAFRYSDTQMEADFLHDVTQHEHRMFPYLAKLAGRGLTEMNIPAAMYMLNHGENFGVRRGRVGFKPRFVERFQIKDPDELVRIVDNFPGAASDR